MRVPLYNVSLLAVFHRIQTNSVETILFKFVPCIMHIESG